MTIRTRAYLELMRPANVVTALADVLAGFAVSGQTDLRMLPGLLTATACLYAGGVVLNDVFDRHVDASERPERPIPSGRVSPQRAAAFGAGLLAAGILAAALVSSLSAAIAVSIAVAAVVYDRWGKHLGALGPLNMGVCRGLNLVLGMTALRHAVESTWAIALINVVYIAAVTMTSRGEVSGGRRRSAGVAVGLLACVCGALVGIGLRSVHGWPAPVAIAAVLAWRVLPAFWAAWRDGRPETIRRAVRTGVLSLVLVDSAIGAAYAGMIYGLVILTVAFVAGRLARLFAVT